MSDPVSELNSAIIATICLVLVGRVICIKVEIKVVIKLVILKLDVRIATDEGVELIVRRKVAVEGAVVTA